MTRFSSARRAEVGAKSERELTDADHEVMLRDDEPPYCHDLAAEPTRAELLEQIGARIDARREAATPQPVQERGPEGARS